MFLIVGRLCSVRFINFSKFSTHDQFLFQIVLFFTSPFVNLPEKREDVFVFVSYNFYGFIYA